MWESADQPPSSEETSLPAPLRRRGSRSQVEAVKAVRRSAEEAGFQLAREQDDTVSHVAQTLARIGENHELAALDGRMIFVERQIERLSGRREAADRMVDSEIAVLRTSLEETLQAFAAATQEHKELVAAAERRLVGLAHEVERHTRAMVESLRVDVSVQMEEAARSMVGLEARLRGQKQAFDQEAAQHARAVAATVAAGRAQLDRRVEEAKGEFEARLTGIGSEIEGRIEAAADGQRDVILTEVDGRLQAVRADANRTRGELADAVQASDDKALGAAEHLEAQINRIRRRLVGDEAEWSAVLGEAGEAVAALRAKVEELLRRVWGLEAGEAMARGASGASLEAVDKRLAAQEQQAEASTTVASDQALRIAALESKLATLGDLRPMIEEQAGAIDYLKVRSAEPVPGAEPSAETEPGPESEASADPGPEPGAEPGPERGSEPEVTVVDLGLVAPKTTTALTS